MATGASIAPYIHFELGQPIQIDYVWGRQIGENTINPQHAPPGGPKGDRTSARYQGGGVNSLAGPAVVWSGLPARRPS